MAGLPVEEKERERKDRSQGCSGRYLHCIVHGASWSGLDAPGAHRLDLDAARGFLAPPLSSLLSLGDLRHRRCAYRHPRETTTKRPENPLWTIRGSIRGRSTTDKRTACRTATKSWCIMKTLRKLVHPLARAFRCYDTSLAETSSLLCGRTCHRELPCFIVSMQCPEKLNYSSQSRSCYLVYFDRCGNFVRIVHLLLKGSRLSLKKWDSYGIE